VKIYKLFVYSLCVGLIVGSACASGKNKSDNLTSKKTGAPKVTKMNAEFMKKVMEASAKIEKIKNKIEAREGELYKNNKEIKKYWAEIVKLQKRINTILNADPELSELEIKRDIVWTTMPSLPFPEVRNRAPQFFPPQQMPK
jgi:predicted nuclease with TOPRIM domain